MRKKLIIGILISLLFIFLSLKKVDIAELKLILRSADYISLIPIFILVVVSMFFRALRWQILIAPIAKVKIRSLFSASSIGLMVNNLLPARIGEIVRAWIIGSRENISKSSVIATVVVERVFDGLTALITLAIVQTFYPFTIPSNLKTALYVLVALCVLIVAYFIYSRNADYSDTNKVDILLKFVPQMARERISSLLVSFREGLKILSNGIDILKAILISFAVWIPIIIIIHLSLLSVRIETSIMASIITFIILSFGLMIPSAPGFIGTIQYCFVLALAIFNFPNDRAIAASIIYHIGTILSINTLGILFFLLDNIKISNIKDLADRS